MLVLIQLIPYNVFNIKGGKKKTYVQESAYYFKTLISAILSFNYNRKSSPSTLSMVKKKN